MAAPLAKGLFQRAIGERGADFSERWEPAVTLADRAKNNAEYAKKVLGTDSLKELRAIPADKLLETVSKPGSERRGPNMVAVDGYFFPKSVAGIFCAGGQDELALLRRGEP